MANLVSPGFDRSRLINSLLNPYEERTIEFRGLNRKSFVEEGEMSDMRNLTSDNYPLLTPRKYRGTYELPVDVKKPISIMVRYDRIAMIAEKLDDSIAFFYDGNEASIVTDLTEDTQMVAINNKICFFPQKTYVEFYTDSNGVKQLNSIYGSLEATYSTTASSPEWPVTMTTTKTTVKLPSATIMLDGLFKKKDAVNISGFIKYKPQGSSDFTSTTINVSCLINDVSMGGTPGTEIYTLLELPGNTFIELVGQGATNISIIGVGTGSGGHSPAEITRECPDIDHVIEWNNRLWGASDKDNTIYACKLGDPTNWQYYQGTSLDSYYAEQGTDGKWTGSAAYSGHLIFFKPGSMTKIYGTSPSTFQVANQVCYGVEPGSSKSVAIVNDVVLYKSSIGIMAYEGGSPYSISNKLKTDFHNVVAGTEGRKYYASVENEDETNELLVLDVDRALWHKEDDVRFRDTATLDGKLLFINDADTEAFEKDKIYIVDADEPTETRIERTWEAVFGPFDENVEGQKIFSKISMRFIAKPLTNVTIYIKMDDGPWERIKQYGYVETGGETVSIVPRRCDRFSIKISGKGDCEIKSLTRRYRRGSDMK